MTLLHEDIDHPRPERGQRHRMLYVALLSLLFLLFLLSIWWARREAAQPLERYGVAPTFTLTDQFEQPVSSDALRGKVVVANFIYTTCTDICPTLSGQMLALQKRLQQEQLLGTEVHLLSFTVDPAQDTPAVLRTYTGCGNDSRLKQPYAIRNGSCYPSQVCCTGPDAHASSLTNGRF